LTFVKYLITGGAGFIGSHLADRLIAAGDEVVLLDDLSTGRAENIEHLRSFASVEFVEGCVTDAALVGELMADADRCIHLASAVGVQLIVDRPLESMLRNTRGMEVVTETAARERVRLLVASTSEIYGKSSTALHEDSDRVLGSPAKSRWTYANAKVHGEMLAFGYHKATGAENIVVRFFNTVGPRQSGMYGMVVPRFVRQALEGEDITVYGDGTQSRCFTHVDDSADALLQLMDCDEAIGQPFNIGCPTEVTIQELATEVVRMTGSASRIRHVPYEEAYGEGFEELGRRKPDTTRIEKLIGWRPRHSIETAIADIIAHEQASGSGLARQAAPGRVEGPTRAPTATPQTVPV
jgi:nucleoside-diphosphate-sugar epimerase